MQRVKSTARKNLQLVGVAAMFLASKYEELYPPEVNEFVYITDNTYSKEQILHMEKHIFKVGWCSLSNYLVVVFVESIYKCSIFHYYLQCLEFQVNAPTSILFLRRFSKAANADAVTHSMAKYFIESASIDYNLSEYLPSEVSARRSTQTNFSPAFALHWFDFLSFIQIDCSGIIIFVIEHSCFTWY